MGNNLTEHGRKMAEIRAQKRAAALRDNLKRRKEADAGRDEPGKDHKGKDDAKSENRE